MRHQQRQQSKKKVGPTPGSRNVQTTLRMPAGLYAQAKAFVEGRVTGSLNELIVNALTAYLLAAERKAIDEAFKPMARDAAYRKESAKIAREFATSDSETLALSERDLVDF